MHENRTLRDRADIPPSKSHPPFSTMSLTIAAPLRGCTSHWLEGTHLYEETLGNLSHCSSWSVPKCHLYSRSAAQPSKPAKESACSGLVKFTKSDVGLYTQRPLDHCSGVHGLCCRCCENIEDQSDMRKEYEEENV
jgi:hypothetical protein